jgi:hypothetical protein
MLWKRQGSARGNYYSCEQIIHNEQKREACSPAIELNYESRPLTLTLSPGGGEGGGMLAVSPLRLTQIWKNPLSPRIFLKN